MRRAARRPSASAAQTTGTSLEPVTDASGKSKLYLVRS